MSEHVCDKHFGYTFECVERSEALAMTRKTMKFFTGCASYNTFDERKIFFFSNSLIKQAMIEAATIYIWTTQQNCI